MKRCGWDRSKLGFCSEYKKLLYQKHLKNIFATGKLSPEAVVSKMETTAIDGKHYTTKFYNLDAILSIGYCVNSKQATDFRIWATKVLKEYLYRGFAINQRNPAPSDFVCSCHGFSQTQPAISTHRHWRIAPLPRQIPDPWRCGLPHWRFSERPWKETIRILQIGNFCGMGGGIIF